MNKLSLTDDQLKYFRGQQGLLLKFGTTDGTPSDVIMSQVEHIERMVNIWIHAAVIAALHSMRIGVVAGTRFEMMPNHVKQFRKMQAESLIVATRNDLDAWKLEQYRIEEWVSDLIDQAVINATQGLIKVRGN
jgi:hypothetical protein